MRVRASEVSDLDSEVFMGVDPGFAKMGIAIICRASDTTLPPKLLALQVTTTKPPGKKEKHKWRKTRHDSTRYAKLCDDLIQYQRRYRACAVGLEEYTPYPGRGSSGTKVKGVVIGTQFWARTIGIYSAPYMASDLKRRFCGSGRGSKDDVFRGLAQCLPDLEADLDDIPSALQEHAVDAAACAVLVMEEMLELRNIARI